MKALKKKLLFVMLLTLILSLLAGCGGNGETSVQEPDETVVEEPSDVALELVTLPTPAVFFGEKPGLSIPQWDEFIFENDPGVAVLAYVDLLQSAYGLTLIEQSEVGTEMQWDLQYQENENATISVSVGPFEEKTKVDIMYSSGIRWQDGAVYEWPESVAAEPAFVSDPEFFFNTGADEKDGSSMTLVLSGTPGVAVYEYISVLKDSYGMTEVGSYTEAQTWQWKLQKGEDENAAVSISLDKRGGGDWDLSFVFGENVTLLQAETQSGGDGIPESEPTPTPEPTPGPEVTDPSVLPDFLANDLSGKYTFWEESNDHKLTFEALDFDVAYVAEEYVELLTNMGYTVVYTEQDDHSSSLGGEMLLWDLQHNDVRADALRSQSTGQVRVKVNSYTAWDKCTIVVEFSDGITMEGFSGGTGGSSDDDFWDECSACHGSGDCTHCGGDDKVSKFQAGIGWVELNCTFCSGGRCPTCGGTGKP